MRFHSVGGKTLINTGIYDSSFWIGHVVNLYTSIKVFAIPRTLSIEL